MSVELLAPAGSPEALNAAVGEGADAVYLNLNNYNNRIRSAGFTYPQFELALRSLRRMGKKLYVMVNTVFEQREADRMYQLLKYLSSTGPDALIVRDFGVLAMIRPEFPSLRVHASTQMNIASGWGANALSRYNVSRVVLARELSLAELGSIRAKTNMELEVYVHGALCVSVSGLCLFSSYLGGKSANRGMCTQACRRSYRCGKEGASPENGTGEGPANGGYYFSPSDLQLLERLPDLAGAGINAIKIEGLQKSADYVGAVVSAYRLVLDSIAAGSPSLEGGNEKIRNSIAAGQNILRGDFARSKTQFYFNCKWPVERPEAMPPAENPVDWLNPFQEDGTGINLGIIQKMKKGRLGLVKCREQNRNGFFGGKDGGLSVGDSVRLHRRDGSGRVTHKLTHAEATAEGYLLSVPDGFGPGDRVYLIQNKAMSKRYKPVINNQTPRSNRQPGHEKAPFPRIDIKKQTCFPDGIYIAVSNINDLYIIQSSRPAKVMLNLDHRSARYLLDEGKPPLPYKPANIIPILGPFFPQADAELLLDDIHRLVDKGYTHFMVNNPGHFSLFRNIRSEVRLIAGPWLYIFNTWSLSFLVSMGADAFVSPLENNRQNLEKTLTVEKQQPFPGYAARSLFFVPVFAWPPLFRIRADLGKTYDFKTFTDNRDEYFSLVTGPAGTTVIPQMPFSITDKIPFLQEAGFKKFIIDLRGPPLKKTYYKDLMRTVNAHTPLPRVSRFNWKDGFYKINEELGVRN